MAVLRAWRITGLDGATLTVEETTESDQTVLSIARDKTTTTVRLNKQGFDDLADLRYDLRLKEYIHDETVPS